MGFTEQARDCIWNKKRKGSEICISNLIFISREVNIDGDMRSVASCHACGVTMHGFRFEDCVD